MRPQLMPTLNTLGSLKHYRYICKYNCVCVNLYIYVSVCRVSLFVIRVLGIVMHRCGSIIREGAASLGLCGPRGGVVFISISLLTRYPPLIVPSLLLALLHLLVLLATSSRAHAITHTFSMASFIAPLHMLHGALLAHVHMYATRGTLHVN